MARHIRQTIAEEEKSYFQKHKTAIIAGSVVAALVVAIALYVKYGKKGMKAPIGSRLRYYYF